MDEIFCEIEKYHSRVKEAQDEYLKFVAMYALSDEKEPEYRALMEGVLPGHIDHKAKLSKNIRKYDIGLSFKTQLANYIVEKKYLRELGFTIAPPSNNKNLDGKIFGVGGISSPKIFDYGCSYLRSEDYEEVVIKPAVGSNSYGVIIKNGSEYRHVYDGKVFSKEKAYDLLSNSFKNDNFLLEEFLQRKGGAARDFKVYCFYGVPYLVLEVDRSLTKPKYCFYDERGDVVDPGLYKESSKFEGSGVDKKIFDSAKDISLNIPSPFIRLDFLVSDNGVYGGEVTSNPGLYYKWGHHWDRLMGVEFAKAKARLFKDVLLGKDFSSYNEIMNNPKCDLMHGVN